MLIGIAVYAVAVAAISIVVSGRLGGIDDFLNGGRGLGLAQGIGLLGGIFVAGTAVGVVGAGYERGWSGAALDLGLALGFAVSLMTILRRLRSYGYASVGALIRAHHGAAAGALAAVLAGSAWIVLLAAFIAAAGRALAGISGWAPTAATAATVVVLFLYAMPGGMRAVAVTNLTQLVVLLGFLVAVAIVGPGLHSGGTTSSGSTLAYLLGVAMLAAPTTVVAPDVILTVASLRDHATARRSVLFVVLSLIGGGLALAALGAGAREVVRVTEGDRVLPALFNLVLPGAAADVGLVVLFGASLAGAVSELMVCTYVFTEEMSRMSLTSRWMGGLEGPRLVMAVVGVLGGVLAALNPHVIEMVLLAFRIYVPAVVPQAIAGLLGRTAPRWVTASMIAGPSVAIALFAAFPGTAEGPFEPVLWGSLVAIALLAFGTRPMTETYESTAGSSSG